MKIPGEIGCTGLLVSVTTAYRAKVRMVELEPKCCVSDLLLTFEDSKCSMTRKSSARRQRIIISVRSASNVTCPSQHSKFAVICRTHAEVCECAALGCSGLRDGIGG